MSDIYVFSSSEEDNDYSTMGLVGALTPEEATFKETLNGDSIVELKHPLDEFGAYRNLVEGNILVVPVPVRTTPEIQNGSCVTTVWTYKVKPLAQLTHYYQRTIWKKASGGKALRVLGEGETVTVVWKYDPDDESNKIKRWKVKSDYGTGWINVNTPEDGPDGFELVTEHKISDNSQAIEEIQSPWSITPQYFRIYEVKKSMDAYEVSARHISYDLLYNMTTYESSDSVTLQTALDGVLNNCFAEHEFKAYTNVTNEQAGLRYMRKNPMDAFLNSDDGLCTLYDVCLVRDNYSLYFLHDPGVNRGVRIQYGKNMTGVSFESSTDEIATRIVPVGENKNGTDLWLSDNQNERYVDSPNIDKYPVPHVYELECENCKVGESDEGGGKVTVAIARARMKAQAEKLISDGCDEPEITMEVEFINLGDTVEYAQFKNLENCFLADYVIVQHPDLDIDVTARISEIEWDCMLDRMNSVTIGQVGKTLANTGITSWQIPSGISGSKIASGTLGNAALKTDIISAIHMQSDSINTQALQANSVTSDKIMANSITSEHIQSESITAGKIAAGAVTSDKIDAGAVTAEKLAAGAVTANSIKAGTITSGMIDTDHFSVGSNLIADGAVGTVQIADSSITSAKIVSLNADVITSGTLATDRLLLTGDDGVVYEINASSSGLSKEELSDEKYKKYLNGTVIVAKSITADQIAANAITSNLIAANAITAAKIDVASLFADDTFTTNIYTSNIYGGKSLKLLTFHDSSVSPSSSEVYEGYRWLDTGVEPSVIRVWKGADVPTRRDSGTVAQTFTYHAPDATSWTPSQSGSGTASPTNIRPLNPGKDSVYFTRSDGMICKATFASTVYGGSINSSGVVTKTYGYARFNGSESWGIYNNSFYYIRGGSSNYGGTGNGTANTAIFSHGGSLWTTSSPNCCFDSDVNLQGFKSTYTSVSALKTYLKSEYDAGHPLEAAYLLKSSTTVSTTIEPNVLTIDNTKGQIVSDITIDLDSAATADTTVYVNGTAHTIAAGEIGVAITGIEKTAYEIYSSTKLTISYDANGWETINDTSAIEQTAENAVKVVNNSVASVTTEYYDSTSATSTTGGSWVTTAPTWQEGHYIWSRTKTTSNDGKTTVYSAEVCITGNTGEKGTDATTYYTWIKYADSPSSGISDNPSGKIYMGVAYNKTTPTESDVYADYSWSLIKGTDGKNGNGVASISYYYTRTSNSNTPDAASVTETSMPSLTSTYRYLWQKEVIKYTNSSDQVTVLLLAVYGDTGNPGEQGVSLVSTTRYYILASSEPAKPTAVPPTDWSTTEPEYQSGSANNLYITDLATFSDGSTSYSDVTLSSSYAAAKEAINQTASLSTTVSSHTQDLSKIYSCFVVDDYGVPHVQEANNPSNQLTMTSGSIDIYVNGIKYSQLASKYVQFGNYQLRRTNDGGLAFKMKE